MVSCELNLLKYALIDDNEYYHFLSGHDYPLVDMKTFDAFFLKNNGYEFVGFSSLEFIKEEKQRYCVYYFFQDYVGRNKKNILWWLNKTMAKLQIILRVDRTRKYRNIVFGVGSNWASIEKNFAEYLIKKVDTIRRMFKYGYCCDEVFLQTMLMNSGNLFKNYTGIQSVVENQQNLRAIDWKRGNPYVYSVKDYKDLKSSNNLFCRKVDTDNDDHAKLLDLLDEKG